MSHAGMTERRTRTASRYLQPTQRLLWRCAVLAGAATFGLAGCTLGPDYKRPDLVLPEAWRVDDRSAAELANTDWWQGFGDPDLDRLIQAALKANKDLRIATWRVAEFDARLQISQSAQYPQVGYTAAAERRRYSEEQPTGGGGLQSGVGPIINNFAFGGILSWEIDLWGRVRRANEASLAELLASQETKRGVMLMVVSSVAAGYVNLIELDRLLALGRQTLQNRREALALIETKYLGGSATRLAVEQVRGTVDAQLGENTIVERDIAKLENALSGLVGRNPGPIQRRQLDAMAVIPMPAGVPADLLTRRPDVMAAEQNLIAASARIGVAMTRYYPTLSLGAALGQASDSTRWLLAETARTGVLGAVLSGPLFDGGRTEAEVRQAEAVQKQMSVRYEQTVQTALAEVDDALVTRAKSSEREAAMQRRVGAMKEIGKLARVRHEGGQASYMEVLDADAMVYEAEGRQAQSRRDMLLALIGVYRAMGGGWMLEQERRQAPAPPAAEVQARTVIESGAQQ